jgi:hypothetical protein
LKTTSAIKDLSPAGYYQGVLRRREPLPIIPSYFLTNNLFISTGPTSSSHLPSVIDDIYPRILLETADFDRSRWFSRSGARSCSRKKPNPHAGDALSRFRWHSLQGKTACVVGCSGWSSRDLTTAGGINGTLCPMPYSCRAISSMLVRRSLCEMTCARRSKKIPETTG